MKGCNAILEVWEQGPWLHSSELGERTRSRKSCSARRPGIVTAFTLLEVMIASGIFFMATFAILALVAGTLRNARALQRGDVDAGMAAAQIYQVLKTNRDTSVSGSGDFGETYPDYSFDFVSGEAQTNGLLQVEIVVNRRGAQKPVDHLTIWVFSPEARSGFGPAPRP